MGVSLIHTCVASPMARHLATLRESYLLPPHTRACFNSVTVTLRALGRSHTASTRSRPSQSVAINETVGCLLPTPMLSWLLTAQGKPTALRACQFSPCASPVSARQRQVDTGQFEHQNKEPCTQPSEPIECLTLKTYFADCPGLCSPISPRPLTLEAWCGDGHGQGCRWDRAGHLGRQCALPTSEP